MSDSIADSTASAVDVVGPEDGEPIVFVHGTIFNRTMWAPQREALAEEYRVIVPDLPGHGELREGSFDLEEGIERVAETIDRHADGPVHLVGLSLGGYVATEYARRNSDRVEDLVLTGSSANPVGALGILSEVVGGAALLASKVGLVERGVDKVAGWWVQKRDLREDVEREIVDAGFDLRPFGEAGFEISGVDFRAAFAGYDGPALVLNGRKDLIMRLGEDDHAAVARDARVRVLDGAGHTCNLERPEAYVDVVRGFVEGSGRHRDRIEGER